MANDKFDELEDGFKSDLNDSAVRARNRTVMLTPEITGQVRARLSRDSEQEEKLALGYSLPQQESDFVATRRPTNYDHFGNEAASPSPRDESGKDRFVENGEVSRGPVKNGFNPISRETHQIPVSHARNGFEERSQIEDSNSSHAVSSPTEIESSLPYLQADQKRPEFDHVEEAPAQDEDSIVWAKMTPVVGFLVSFDLDPNGQVYPVRSGRAIVSSEVPNGGNYLLLTDESVSPMHAIIRVTEDSQFQVLDNLSEYGTTVVRPETGEELNLSGDKAMVRHGDLLRFGKRSFSLCLIGKT